MDGFVVVLRDGTDVPVGLGVLLPGRTVLTCAHVVNAALGRDAGAAARPAGAVSVSWPKLPTHQPIEALVVGWRSLAEGDLAALRLGAEPPPGATAAVLADGRPGAALQVFGYPAGRPDGQLAEVRAVGTVGGGRLQLNTREPTSPDVRAGYSGGPVVDTASGAVIGVIAQAPGGSARDSQAIPAATLAAFLGETGPRAAAPTQSVQRPDRRYAPAPALTVLHLSSPRLADQRLLDRLRADLDAGRWPDLVIVTGDLADRGLPSEYERVGALLERLADATGLPRHRVAIIPGNHDVNRKACSQYFDGAEADEREPLPPYWPKWRHYAAAFDRFYAPVDAHRPDFTPDRPWTLFTMPELRVVVAGLNSTISDSHRESDHVGWLGERQLSWFAEQLRTYREDGWLVLGAVHHDPGDTDSLCDAYELDRQLGPTLHLLLHGGAPDRYQLRTLHPDLDARAALGGGAPAPLNDHTRRHRLYVDKRVLDTDRLLDEIATVTTLRHPGVDIATEPGDQPHIVVTRRDQTGPFDRWPIGAVAGPVTERLLSAFVAGVDQVWRAADPNLRSYLIYTGTPPEPAVRDAARRAGIVLHSLIEYRGVIDLATARTRQRERVDADARYPAALYVPQRFRRDHPAGERDEDGDPVLEEGALSRVASWLGEGGARFVTVLADFGRGKTFLMRQLVRELPDLVGGLDPLLLELHSVEKGPDLYDLVGQYLRRLDVPDVTDAKVRHLISRGRVAVLLDGFDELVQRVTYPTAAAYLETLIQAATGEAKIVLTSRTQHFRDDSQVRRALLTSGAGRDAGRIIALADFTATQIKDFLVRLYGGDQARAADRYARLEQINDLLGLSSNPRMLAFIAALPDAKLDEAQRSNDRIGAADLYREILDYWLDGEVKRQRYAYGRAVLGQQPRLDACRELALRLWAADSDTIDADDLTAVADILSDLKNLGYNRDQAAHTIGSGSLLTRDRDGFGFVHRSVMEWLVADAAASALLAGREPMALNKREMTDLMTDFFCDLAGHDTALSWAAHAASTPQAAANATRVRARLGRREATTTLGPIDLTGQDLRDQDLAALAASRDGAGLVNSVLARTVWADCALRDANLSGADLTSADLRGVELTEVNLSRANLTNADFTRARLTNVDLTEATLTGTTWTQAAIRNHRPTKAREFAEAAVAGVDQATPMLAATDLVTAATALGTGLLAVGRGQTVEIVDLARRRPVRVLSGLATTVLSLATLRSPRGSRTVLAVGGGDGAVRLLDPVTGAAVAQPVTPAIGPIRSLAVLGDHILVIGSDDGSVQLWDPFAHWLHSEPFRADTRAVQSLAALDRRTLATGHEDGILRLWDPDTGRSLGEPFSIGAPLLSLAAVQNGGRTFLAVTTENSIRLWDPGVGRIVGTISAETSSWLRTLTAVSMPDRQTLLAAVSELGTVWLVDPDGKHVDEALAGHTATVRSMASSDLPGGRALLATASSSVVRLWDPVTGAAVGKPLVGHSDIVRTVAVVGRWLASGGEDCTIRMWGPHAGATIGEALVGHTDWVQSMVAVDLAGSYTVLATGGDDHTIRLWDPARGVALGSLSGHAGRVQSMAAVRRRDGGQILATGSSDNTVRLWDPTAGTAIGEPLSGHSATVLSLAEVHLGDGRTVLASGSGDRTIRLWEPATGAAVGKPLTGHDDWVHALASVDLRDGRTVLAAASGNAVWLWDPRTGAPASEPLRGHTATVRSLAPIYLPDGRAVLASGSADGTVRLWRLDAAGGTHVGTLVPASDTAWAALSADGRAYKSAGDVSGALWWAIKLCRFEAGELDPYDRSITRLPDGAPLY